MSVFFRTTVKPRAEGKKLQGAIIVPQMIVETGGMLSQSSNIEIMKLMLQVNEWTFMHCTNLFTF